MTNLSSLKKKYLRIYTDKFRGKFLVFVITVDIFSPDYQELIREQYKGIKRYQFNYGLKSSVKYFIL
jgi:hypothetical protein